MYYSTLCLEIPFANPTVHMPLIYNGCLCRPMPATSLMLRNFFLYAVNGVIKIELQECCSGYTPYMTTHACMTVMRV